MKVLFIVEHGNAPSIRLRLTDHFASYRLHGIEPTLLPVRSKITDRLHAIREAARHDVVVLHRITGFTHLQLTLLQRANPRIIFDFDDALMFRDQKHGQPLRAKTFAKFLRTIERCAGVVAGNEFLASFARGGDRNVVVLPTAVDVTSYRVKETRLSRGTTVGWLGLSDGFRYLQQIGPALRQLSGMFPELRLKVVSDKPSSLEGVQVVNEIWRSENEQTNLAEFDVGIMPLSDSAWTRGKCSYKILQYMAVGTAVVASPVGMNAHVIDDGENGFLASSESDWVRSIAELLEDAELRAEFGRRGRMLMEKEYSADRYREAYVRLLHQIGATDVAA